MMTTYAVKYALSPQPVSRRHRTIGGLVRDLDRCRKAARRGGDQQGIHCVAIDDSGAWGNLPDDLAAEVDAIAYRRPF